MKFNREVKSLILTVVVLLTLAFIGMWAFRACSGPKIDYVTPTELHSIVINGPRSLLDVIQGLDRAGYYQADPELYLRLRQATSVEEVLMDESLTKALEGSSASYPGPHQEWRSYQLRDGCRRQDTRYSIELWLEDGEFQSMWTGSPSLALVMIDFDEHLQSIGYFYIQWKAHFSDAHKIKEE